MLIAFALLCFASCFLSKNVFFNPNTGAPLKYYSITPDGEYKFYSSGGFDPVTGDTLKIVTKEIVLKYLKPPKPDVPKSPEIKGSLNYVPNRPAQTRTDNAQSYQEPVKTRSDYNQVEQSNDQTVIITDDKPAKRKEDKAVKKSAPADILYPGVNKRFCIAGQENGPFALPAGDDTYFVSLSVGCQIIFSDSTAYDVQEGSKVTKPRGANFKIVTDKDMVVTIEITKNFDRRQAPPRTHNNYQQKTYNYDYRTHNQAGYQTNRPVYQTSYPNSSYSSSYQTNYNTPVARYQASRTSNLPSYQTNFNNGSSRH